jgi:hypothetical protein
MKFNIEENHRLITGRINLIPHGSFKMQLSDRRLITSQYVIQRPVLLGWTSQAASLMALSNFGSIMDAIGIGLRD